MKNVVDASPPPVRPVTADGAVSTAPTTRDRILDASLDLFTEHGFDGASLREIAQRVGVTKAALYYHFSSKEDILMALHQRLHNVGRAALGRIGSQGPVTLAQWAAVLEEVMGQMVAQRKIFLMHERNQAALEKLHRDDHDAQHEDMQSRMRTILSDRRISVRDRVRMAASFGSIAAGLFMVGDAFADVSNEEVGQLLRDAVRDLLAPRSTS
jgi:AcrR family transcriptional regulator